MEYVSSPKSRRPYHSPHRQEQARQTRRAILDAALRLFVRRGYSGASLAEIAQEAGVSLKTVEAAFGTKAKLLAALWDVSVVGDDEAVSLAERAWFREMLAEPDPRRQLALHARNARQIKQRVGALIEVVRVAAWSDPEIGARWRLIQDQFMENQRMVAESLAAKGALRPGLDAAGAAETLWMLNHPSVYCLAVFERAWSDDRYEDWLADAFIHQLLR
jgi:AcrR family transcriptional regulator